MCVCTLSGLLEWPACVSREPQPRREARIRRLCVCVWDFRNAKPEIANKKKKGLNNFRAQNVDKSLARRISNSYF